MLQNEDFVAKVGPDTAENGPTFLEHSGKQLTVLQRVSSPRGTRSAPGGYPLSE